MKNYLFLLGFILSLSSSAQYLKTTRVFGDTLLLVPESRPSANNNMHDSIEIADWYFQNAYSAWEIDGDSARARLLYDTMLIYIPIPLIDTDPHRFAHFYAHPIRFYWDQCYDHQEGKWFSRRNAIKGFALQMKLDSIYLDYMEKRKILAGDENYKNDLKWKQARDARGINQAWNFSSLLSRFR